MSLCDYNKESFTFMEHNLGTLNVLELCMVAVAVCCWAVTRALGLWLSEVNLVEAESILKAPRLEISLNQSPNLCWNSLLAQVVFMEMVSLTPLRRSTI